MLVISVLLSSAHLSVLIGEEIWKRPWFLISVQSLLDVFGFFLLVLIGVVLLEYRIQPRLARDQCQARSSV